MPAASLVLLVAAAAAASFLDWQHLLVVGEDCPLDLTWSNFSWAASACSSPNQRTKCCRYLNAFVAVSVAHYANTTGSLGVPSSLNGVCQNYILTTFESNGIPHNATLFCGVGPKIHVAYQCQGRTSIFEILQSLNFDDVIRDCKLPLATDNSCRRCLNSSIAYLHHVIGAQDNVTLNACRDATFVALANQGDNALTSDFAGCFFSIKELQAFPVNATRPSPQQVAPASAPAIVPTGAPSKHLSGLSLYEEHHHAFRLALIPTIGIMVAGIAILLVIVLIILICKKSKAIKSAGTTNKNSWKMFTHSHDCKWHGPSTTFQRFSYKKIKKATNNFSIISDIGGFGIIYKASFDDGFIAAVKRMSEDANYQKEIFFREMDLLSRLHHRHVVSLRGFCVERHERFLIYEYMENGSLRDCLHSSDKSPLTWQIRFRIAVDVANALEYLHFYCDPPLCHRNIKSSNVLLDKNFLAKVADFRLAHASTKEGSVAEPVNVHIQGTPGYIDPEYVVTQELSDKSDIYSYGILLLELVTGRYPIQDDQNLIEWSREFLETNSRLFHLVDPQLGGEFDLEQVQLIVEIIKCCTRREVSQRPSIKQVLRLLYESLDPVHGGFVETMEDEDSFGVGRNNMKEKRFENEEIACSGDATCLHSSSSTSRSCCSRSVLLESGSPHSAYGITSF